MLNKNESAGCPPALLTNEREISTSVEQISLFDLYLTHDNKISQLAGELEELNEALKYDHNSDGWLAAYNRYLDISAELIHLKAVRDE